MKKPTIFGDACECDNFLCDKGSMELFAVDKVHVSVLMESTAVLVSIQPLQDGSTRVQHANVTMTTVLIQQTLVTTRKTCHVPYVTSWAAVIRVLLPDHVDAIVI